MLDDRRAWEIQKLRYLQNTKRPVCGQCLKLGLKCDGYGREIRFINVSVEPAKAQAHQHDKGSTQITAPAALVRSAYAEKYMGMLWSGYLPGSKPFPAHIMQYTGGGWTNTLPQLCRASPAIQRILLAVSLSAAGRAGNNRWEREEGVRCYMGSLGEMSAALSNRTRENITTLCVVSRLYGLYEVLYSHGAYSSSMDTMLTFVDVQIFFGQDDQDRIAQARNWRNHVNGELAVVTSQSPETYVSGYLHQLFVDGRLHLTTSAIQARKKTVLSNPEWKTVPWREIPKTPKDRLIDIFVEIPTLLENLDIMRGCQETNTRATLQHELFQTCWELERELINWRIQLGIKDPTYTLGSSPYSLEHLAACHIMCLYWSLCIILYSTLRIVSNNPQTPLPPHTEPRIYCHRIAEVVSLLLHPLAGGYGVHLTSFPVSAAMMYLNAVDGEMVSEEKRMIFEAFKVSGHGRTVERFNGSMQHIDAVAHGTAMMGSVCGESQVVAG
ncbi:hypothetical protein FQN50_003543 [Emmonsiellopsis sp. PD_5]|nr:hypothetical protein FQN50_003543 [Emmonsiellopsis sp. PD_5]